MLRLARGMAKFSRVYADLSVPRTHWDIVVDAFETGKTFVELVEKRWGRIAGYNAQDLVSSGFVKLEGTVITDSTLGLTHKQTLTIDIPLRDGISDPSTIPLDIIHQDDDLIIINKQPGIVVQPQGCQSMDNVLSALHARFRSDDPEKDIVPQVRESDVRGSSENQARANKAITYVITTC